MIRVLFSLLVIFLLTPSFAQLKVHSNGTVSVGTLTSSGYTLTVNGYAGIKIIDGVAHIRLSPASSNAVFGTASDRVAFWESATGHHQLDASHFNISSDSTLKLNMVTLDSTTGVSTIMQLNPISYNYKTEVALNGENAKTEYGFIAQEVQQVVPDLVDSSMGVLVMNIDGIIPFLVLAVQEQQNTIDSLNERINNLENAVYDGGINTKSAGLVTNEKGELIELGQNNPNPFKESTFIPYNIPLSTTSAQIIIYDMRGQELKSYQITEFGESQLLIEGNSFKAGMYIYALIVDGKYVDSKRMILSK